MLRDPDPKYKWPSFIAMDEPRRGVQRKTVAPMFTPTHLNKLAISIRERSADILDKLPRNETFDFVERVYVEADDRDAGSAVRFSVGGTA